MAGGFGNHPFGNAPFGRGDYSQDILVANYPREYYQDEDDVENDPAYHYLTVAKESLDSRYAEVDAMNTLMAPLEMPSGLIPYLADSIGVGVNDYEPEGFQRSIVNNAVRYYTLKGTSTAYSIRGLMSGYEVEVLQMWQVTPDIASGIDDEYLRRIGDNFYSELNPTEVSGVSGDIPYYGNCDFCLTAFVGIVMTLRREAPEGYNVYVLDRTLDAIKSIMPIHVRELFLESKLIFKDIDMAIEEINQEFEEISYRNVGVNYYYDLWPADVVSTDVGINVRGYTQEI